MFIISFTLFFINSFNWLLPAYVVIIKFDYGIELDLIWYKFLSILNYSNYLGKNNESYISPFLYNIYYFFENFFFIFYYDNLLLFKKGESNDYCKAPPI